MNRTTDLLYKKTPQRRNPWGVEEILLREFLAVEGIPVVEVVEIDGIADAAIVRAVDGAANASAGVIAVDVASNRGVESGDRFRVQFGGVCFHPGLCLNVGGFARDEGDESGFIDADAVEHHLVIAHAAAGVVSVEFASGFQRSFLPEAGKMKDAQRTFSAAADGWYDALIHSVLYKGVAC